MHSFNNMDLRAVIVEAVTDIFDLMLSSDLELLDYYEPKRKLGNDFVGSVGFAGDVSGVISIGIKESTARLFTSIMLDMDPDELDGTEEIRDVIGELGNMLGGRLKSEFCNSGLPCVLAIPSVTHGKDFRVIPLKGATQESLFFRHKKDIITVKLHLRSDS